MRKGCNQHEVCVTSSDKQHNNQIWVIFNLEWNHNILYSTREQIFSDQSFKEISLQI